MPASQTHLADRYHTTTRPNNQLTLEGTHHVVGLDIDEKEMPEGRFIWFTVDNPKNDGTVLRGTTVCSYRVSSLAEVRKHAIACATRWLGNERQATFEVDEVIKHGGMLP